MVDMLSIMVYIYDKRNGMDMIMGCWLYVV